MLAVLSFIVTFFISYTYASANSADMASAKNRCVVTTAGESLLYSNEFENPALHLGSKWWYTLDEMEQQFETTYNSGKRLPARAYYNTSTGKFVIPVKMSDNTYKEAELTENFILSVQKHIESALKQRYADYAFFPDMGHSHLYFPEEHWKKEYNYTLESDKAAHYQQMLADPEMLVLYHTAEKLLSTDADNKLLQDPEILYRYYNRNVVGTNKQSELLQIVITENPEKNNTVSGLPGYASWSAGFSLHASKDGCFTYRHEGKEYYFDLSLEDLIHDPSIPLPADYFM